MNEFNKYLQGTRCELGTSWYWELQGALPWSLPSESLQSSGQASRTGHQRLQTLRTMQAVEELPQFRKKHLEQCKGLQSRNELTIRLCSVGREKGKWKALYPFLYDIWFLFWAHPAQTLLRLWKELPF